MLDECFESARLGKFLLLPECTTMHAGGAVTTKQAWYIWSTLSESLNVQMLETARIGARYRLPQTLQPRGWENWETNGGELALPGGHNVLPVGVCFFYSFLSILSSILCTFWLWYNPLLGHERTHWCSSAVGLSFHHQCLVTSAFNLTIFVL